MGNLKRNVNRFFLRNRDKGIPNLMLWISATNLVVYLLSLFGLQNEVLGVLCFDAEKILARADLASGQLYVRRRRGLPPCANSAYCFSCCSFIFIIGLGVCSKTHGGRSASTAIISRASC